MALGLMMVSFGIALAVATLALAARGRLLTTVVRDLTRSAITATPIRWREVGLVWKPSPHESREDGPPLLVQLEDGAVVERSTKVDEFIFTLPGIIRPKLSVGFAEMPGVRPTIIAGGRVFLCWLLNRQIERE